MTKRAGALNGEFDEWDTQRKGLAISARNMPKHGTVDWLFREYEISRAYLDKVAVRSRDDYEWAMDQVCNTLTKRVIGSATALRRPSLLALPIDFMISLSRARMVNACRPAKSLSYSLARLGEWCVAFSGRVSQGRS
jgi:hypothetical protein